MSHAELTRRFLEPRHALCDSDIIRWQGRGEAATPSAEAWCRVSLAWTSRGTLSAAFEVFGPPVVIAAVDWLCECVGARMPTQAAALNAQDVENALHLAPEQRYVGLLVIDALAKALSDLGS